MGASNSAATSTSSMLDLGALTETASAELTRLIAVAVDPLATEARAALRLTRFTLERLLEPPLPRPAASRVNAIKQFGTAA